MNCIKKHMVVENIKNIPNRLGTKVSEFLIIQKKLGFKYNDIYVEKTVHIHKNNNLIFI